MKGGTVLKYIKGIFADIKHFFASLTVKKVIVGLIILAFVTVPTVLAGYYFLEEEIFFSDDTFSVTLYGAGDRVIATEERDVESAPKNSLTHVFYTLSTTQLTPSRGQPLSDGKAFVRAEYTYKGEQKSLICYFSVDKEQAGYYTDEDKNKLLIPDDINNIFLSLPQSEVFYESSVPYSLTTVDGDKITPVSATWNYKTVNGEYRSAAAPNVTDKILTYDITGAIDFSFESIPQVRTVKVYGSDGLIYDGNGDGLSSLPIDHEGILRVTVDAEWEQSDGADCYGKLLYDFYVNIKNRSVFTLSTPRIRKGGFSVINVTNVNDISKLSCISSVEATTPEFMWYNGALRAVIQVPEDTDVERITFELSYGASSDVLVLELFNAETSQVILSNYIFSDGASVERHFEGALSSVKSNYPIKKEQVYFRGNFLNPTDFGFSLVFSHGDTLVFGDSAQHRATAYGNEYSASKDTSVKVLQNGVVAKVAYDEYLGSYVVIDHGCGLMTYYAHLSTVDVSFGDILLAGQHVGTCGQNHLGGYGFSLYCAAGGESVSPQALWEQSIKR